MKCSQCSWPLLPVVALDIDGTLGDYHSHFLEFAEEYLGYRERWTYDGYGKFRMWFCRTYRVDKRTYEDIKLAYRQGAQKRSMPTFPGTRALADTVRGAGAELWVTTTRPYMRLDNIDPDTRAWLARAGVQYDHMIYDEDKYPRLAKLVDRERVVAVLDDLEEQYAAARQVFGSEVALLRRTRWNAVVPADAEVGTLHAAIEVICNKIYNWKERYA